MRRLIVRLALALTVALSAVVNGVAQQLRWLGTLGGNRSVAFGVSEDGSVVVGTSLNSAGVPRAFRWTPNGMEDLGTLGGTESAAFDVSAYGAKVVGWARDSSGRVRAFRWTAYEGMRDLGTLGGSSSYAYAVRRDGALVVGEAQNASGQYRAFAASGGTMSDLIGVESVARGISPDGNVVVGGARQADGRWRAFRRAGSTLISLGTLPGGGTSEAYDVSTNGAVVVGYAYNSAGRIRAFRWTASDGMQDLGTLGGSISEARGVSADGTIVVGWATNSAGQMRAFRWVQGRGMQDLNTVYAALLTGGSYLIGAFATSPDGRYIVGFGYNAATNREEAFLLDTRASNPADVNRDGTVNNADLLEVLFNFGWQSCQRTPELRWIGVLSGGNESQAVDVSTAGQVVTGTSRSAAGQRAVRWFYLTGSLGDLGARGGWSIAAGASADGSRVVGSTADRFSLDRSVAVMWRQIGPYMVFTELPTPPRSDSYADDISADGTTVVGTYAIEQFDPSTGEWFVSVYAFRWTNGSSSVDTIAENAPTREQYSSARCVSADGSVVGGFAKTAQTRMHAFRWSAVDGMVSLGTLPDFRESIALAASSDGSVLVGSAERVLPSALRAFRWTASDGMQDLGTLGGSSSEARGVSADGTIVVGWATNSAGQMRAFRWVQGRGMQDLNIAYASLLQSGSRLEVANAVSPDGRYVVGQGYNAVTNRREGFWLDTGCLALIPADVNRDGTVNNADLLEVLFNFGWRLEP